MLILNLLFMFSLLFLLSVIARKIYIYFTKDKYIDAYNKDLIKAQKEIESDNNKLIREIEAAVLKQESENQQIINENNIKDFLNNPDNWFKHIEEIPEVRLESGQILGGKREFFIKKDSEIYRLYQSGLPVDLYQSNNVIIGNDISSSKQCFNITKYDAGSSFITIPR